jgi:hypothetical protein
MSATSTLKVDAITQYDIILLKYLPQLPFFIEGDIFL